MIRVAHCWQMCAFLNCLIVGGFMAGGPASGHAGTNDTPLMASTWAPRVVRPDELRDKRSPIEDELRLAVLAAFEETQVAGIREILNQEWSKQTVQQIGQILVDATRREAQSVVINDPEWKAITDLLAMVARMHPSLSGETRGVFERLFEQARIVREQHKVKANFWGDTVSSIAKYGTKELLTEAFWQGVQDGYMSGDILETFADGEIVKRLRLIVQTMHEQKNPSRVELRRRTALEAELTVVEMFVEYPEIRQVSSHNRRIILANALARHRDRPIDALESIARGLDNAEDTKVLSNIVERIRIEQTKRPHGTTSQVGSPQ